MAVTSPHHAGVGRIAAIDFARAAAVCAVVLYHATIIIGPAAPASYYHVNYLFGLVRMPTLMLVSGLLVRHLLDQDGEATAIRAAHLGWLFVAWLPVSIVCQWIFLGDHLALGAMATELIAPSTELWYLWALALLTATLPIAKRAGPRVALALSAAAAFGAFNGVIVTNNVAHLSILKYAVFFYAGVWAGDLVVAGMALARRRPACCLAAVAIFVGAHWLQHRFGSGGGGLAAIAEAAAGSLAILTVSVQIERVGPLAAMLAWLGRRTLPIYLAHSPLIHLAIAAGALRFLPHGLAPALLALASVPAALTLKVALCKLGAHAAYSMPAMLVERLRPARFQVPRLRAGAAIAEGLPRQRC